jgi:hypothetical protein
MVCGASQNAKIMICLMIFCYTLTERFSPLDALRFKLEDQRIITLPVIIRNDYYKALYIRGNYIMIIQYKTAAICRSCCADHGFDSEQNGSVFREAQE